MYIYTVYSTLRVCVCVTRYEWRVGGEGSEVIDVEPRQGTILPSESQVTGTPSAPVVYATYVRMYTYQSNATILVQWHFSHAFQ